jgi:hypothetical protein
MVYRKHEEKLTITIATDASYKTGGDGKSISGWIVYLGGNAIDWKSKLQSKVALNTAEAEFTALGEGFKNSL